MKNLTAQEKQNIRKKLDLISDELESIKNKHRFWSRILALLMTIGVIIMIVSMIT